MVNLMNRKLASRIDTKPVSDSPGDQTLDALRASESRYRRLFETARDGILLLAFETGQIEDVNPYLIELLGYSHGEFLGKKLWDVGPFSDRVESKEMFAQLQTEGYVRYEDLPLRTKLGKEVQVEFVSNTYVCDGIKIIQCNIRDITVRKQLEDEVRRLALYDPLTELPNRRLLLDRLSQAMAASKRNGCYGALIFIDLDDFKELNDTHGHALGDQLLIEAAQRVRASLRDVDTVARLGGDEFVVILSPLNADRALSKSQAETASEKIRAKLSAPYFLTIKDVTEVDRIIEYHGGGSIGVKLFISSEVGQAHILHEADAAMYEAKSAGGNLIRFADG